MSRTNRSHLLNKGVTLAELIIAVVLLSVVVLTVSSIDRFSRFHLATSQHRAELQNKVSYIMEHMSKNILGAIGNEKNTGENSVVGIVPDYPSPGFSMLHVRIDLNQNGKHDSADERAFWWYHSNYSIYYWPAGGSAWEWLDPSMKIAAVTFLKPVDAFGILDRNYIDVSVTACWDPTSIDLAVYPDGTPDNPCVTMSQRMRMPSVSTN